MTTGTKAILAITLALLVALGARSNENETAQTPVGAPSVEVEYHSTATFEGLDYHFIEGVMRGTVEREDGSTGSYEVPILMAYPEGGGNRVGVVELPHPGGFPEDGEPTEVLRGLHVLRMTESYLLREGYTYLAVQGLKGITEAMGSEPPDSSTRRRLAYGTIEEAADRDEVWRDASRWLRDPSDFTGNGAPDLTAPDHLIATGFSLTGILLYTFLDDGINEAEDGSLFYDGVIPVGTVNQRGRATDEHPYLELEAAAERPDQGDARVLIVDDQTVLELLTVLDNGGAAGGHLTRDLGHDTGAQDPNWRKWEVAGTSHVPPWLLSQEVQGGLDNPNRVDWRPVVRAAFHHGTNWIVDETDPPDTRHIAGGVDEEDDFTAAVDEDGNALGGVRLPNLPRSLDDGTTVGAPVGTYTGVPQEAFEQDLTFAERIAGSFEPFPAEVLAERYPSREEYVARYRAALDEILDEGYILEEDYHRLLARAEGIEIPEPGTEDGVGTELGPDPDGERVGVVRLELVQQAGWAPEVRTHAWFADGQEEPVAHPWPWPPDNRLEEGGPEACHDLRGRETLPAGEVDGREYLDAGEAVTLAAGGTEIVLPRRENSRDDAAWLWHEILYKDHVRPADVLDGADYDVHLSGGPALPGTTHERALSLPPAPQLRFPDMAESVIIPARADYRFLPEAGDEPESGFAFVGFLDQVGPAGLCVGPRSGAITVPAQFLERMPAGGRLQYGHVLDRAAKHDHGRIDLLGIHTLEAAYLIDNTHLQGVTADR